MIRVRYTRNGEEGWHDFHCSDDARRFAEWGTDSGVFVRAQLWPTDAEPVDAEAAIAKVRTIVDRGMTGHENGYRNAASDALLELFDLITPVPS